MYLREKLKEEKPETQYCYETRVFGGSKRCPDLDPSITMEPRCKKYGKGLSWNLSGRVLKCEECREEVPGGA